jgi:hypothetical protein
MKRCGIRTDWAIFFWLGGTAFLVCAVLASRYGPVSTAPLFVLFGAGSFLLLRAHVSFDDEQIEAFDGFFRKKRLRSQLIGRKRIYYQHVSQIALLTSPAEKRPLQIPALVRIEPELQRWLEEIPDLDAAERNQVEAAATTEFGEQALRWRRLAAKGLRWSTWLLAAWAFFRPQPYHAAIIANLALVAVALALLVHGKGAFSADQRRNDPRPSIAAPLVLPGMVVAVRMLLDLHLLEIGVWAVWTGAGALLLGAAVALADRLAPRRSAIFFIYLLIGLYVAGGAAAYLNAALDVAPPQRYAARVLEKNTYYSKGTKYRLVLSPWGPRKSGEHMDVPREIYERVQPGGDVEVALHRGWLGIPWYTVR